MPSSVSSSPEIDPEKRIDSSGHTSRKDEQSVAYDVPEVKVSSYTGKKLWKLKLRTDEEVERNNWWFASTAIPLLAATLAPLANVLSIAALVTFWRMHLIVDGKRVESELDGVPFKDPAWCYWLNVASLIFALVGNLFQLFNFTNRIRYIIALPTTIACWYLSTAFLIGITVSMHIYTPPIQPDETYTQGFWYAVEAAVLYLICSMILMVNMLGYFLGHYPSTFQLTGPQRTLILQTMLFFIWLAGGGAIFSYVETKFGEENWSFVDGLYFCDVTVLTVGFGDLYPTDNIGRGIVFPYSVGGIIMLGLVISSINKFVAEIGEEKVIKRHIEKHRIRTVDRTVSSSIELKRRETADALHDDLPKPLEPRPRFEQGISQPIEAINISQATKIPKDPSEMTSAMGHKTPRRKHRLRNLNPVNRIRNKPKLVLMREERDRFNAMRSIQHQTAQFKKWTALTFSVIAFAILWCVGAIVFWQCEKGDENDMTYFKALYFGYVSLLTIGYGDLSPKSNPGRAFFVVWSIIAVPTMTVLISDMGDTVIGNFKNAIGKLADFTILPKEGIWRNFLDKHPWLLLHVQTFVEHRREKKRLARGMQYGDEDSQPDVDVEHDPQASVEDNDGGDETPHNLEELAEEAECHEPSEPELANRLAIAIGKVASDLKLDMPKSYSYEEWVEFTRLIKFTSKDEIRRRDREAGFHDPDEDLDSDDDEEFIDWDWIGEDSPMMAKKPESEFVLDRLTESLSRYMRRMAGERTPEAGMSLRVPSLKRISTKGSSIREFRENMKRKEGEAEASGALRGRLETHDEVAEQDHAEKS